MTKTPSPTILIVDNDEDIVRAMSIRLQSAGCRCLTAGTGAQGLGLFQGCDVDLVITDLNMPGGDGVSMLEAIRRTSDVPVIVMTGFVRDYRDRLQGLGHLSCLRKPFDTETLIDLVEMELSMVGRGAIGSADTRGDVTALRWSRPTARSTEQDREATMHAHEGKERTVAKNKILVADDDRNLLLALSVRLTAAGHEVITAQDAEEAVQFAQQHELDLVLLNIGMPAGEGYSVQERMQRVCKLGTTPVIYLTGDRSQRSRDLARRLGAFALLYKPFDELHLLAAVDDALSARHRADAA